jgi:hypothetical protein
MMSVLSCTELSGRVLSGFWLSDVVGPDVVKPSALRPSAVWAEALLPSCSLEGAAWRRVGHLRYPAPNGAVHCVLHLMLRERKASQEGDGESYAPDNPFGRYKC